MKTGLQLRFHQQLALTPQLQQAIRLLQLSQLELRTELRQIVEGNPLLDLLDENPDEGSADDADPHASASTEGDDPVEWNDVDLAPESPIDFSLPSSGGSGQRDDELMETQASAPETLRDHLLWQLNLSSLKPRERQIGTVLIDALNEDGYLTETPEALHAAMPSELQVGLGEIEAVRRQIQQFDPTGVASTHLRDCLRVQLHQFDAQRPECALALRIVDTELELLARNDVPRLARRLHASEADVLAAAALIRQLDPRPGTSRDATPVEYVAPDVYAWRDGTRWQVGLNPGSQPRLELNQHYCGLIAQARGSDASWMRGQLQEARWLIKSLESRAETLLKVAGAIVARQSAFLDFGPEAMHPMVLRDIAEDVQMHESTISRVTTRKYIRTPRGTFELKHFFSSGVSTEDGGSASATAIQAIVRKLVDAEDPRKPLSDQAIAAELQRKGIQVARRTVAKYREALRIPSSNERMRAL